MEINCTCHFQFIHQLLYIGPVAIKLNEVPKAYQSKTLEPPPPPSSIPKAPTMIKIKAPRPRKRDVIQAESLLHSPPRQTAPSRKPVSQWYTPTQIEDLGSITYHTLLCELQCGRLDRRIHALNALQALAHSEKISGISKSFPQIIDEMLRLLLPHILPPRMARQDIP